MCVHVLLLVVAAIVYEANAGAIGNENEPDRRVAIVLAETQPDQQTEYLDSEDILKSNPVSQSTASQTLADVKPNESPVPLESILPTNPDGVSPVVPQFDADQATKVPAGGVQGSNEIKLSQEDLESIEAEQKALAAQKPKGKPATASIFNSGELSGHKWVFVIDRSNSMGSGGLGVLEKAARELSNAVNSMGTNHEFQVVAYNHETVLIDERRLLVANDANKKKVHTFVYNLAATGGTEHFSAMVVALTYRPDVVVLMTDGSFPELKSNQIEQLENMAGSRTRVTCLQFGDRDEPTEGRFMEILANQTGGAYKYIDVRKWE